MTLIAEEPHTKADALYKLAIKSQYDDYKSMRFLYYLALQVQPELIVEFGTFLGCSSAHMAVALRTDNSRIITVDNASYPMTSLSDAEIAWQELGVADRIEQVQGDTRDKRDYGKIDLLFMDAAHTHADLQDEWRAICHTLARDHVVVVDDIWLHDIRDFGLELSHMYDMHITLPFHKGLGVYSTNIPLFMAAIGAAGIAWM
jgi:predicted O-methyltransferase YrrM